MRSATSADKIELELSEAPKSSCNSPQSLAIDNLNGLRALAASTSNHLGDLGTAAPA